MNSILRWVGVTAALCGCLFSGARSATAGPGAIAFVGEATIDCFGCGELGSGNGTAELCAEGYVTNDLALTPCVVPAQVLPWASRVIGTPHPLPINGNVFATYSVGGPPIMCPIAGAATGSTTGAVEVVFTWTRIGATALITTQGDINGGGVAVFVVTDPAVGSPCGGPVRAVFAGVITGT